MSSGESPLDTRHLAWVYPGSLSEALDSATWLETTRELRLVGWRVTLLAAGPVGERSLRGVGVRCVPQPEVYFLRQLVYHARVLRVLASERRSLDLVLFHQMSAPWMLLLRLARRLAPGHFPLLVMDTRDLHPVEGDWKGRLRISFLMFAHRLANRWAHGQTAITDRMAELVRIPPQHLWGTWPSGVIPDRFAPAQQMRHWPSGGEPLQLIYVGRLQNERNLVELCQAVERSNADGMAFVLSLVGDGAESAALERFAAGAEGRVRVVPPIPHDRVPELLSQAHIGVTSLPPPEDKKYQASSPLKLLEYMAAGLPVLATRNVCHTDVVGSGQYAFWAEDASVDSLYLALKRAWLARLSLRELGEEAATAAQDWTWQESAKKLASALEGGLGSS